MYRPGALPLVFAALVLSSLAAHAQAVATGIKTIGISAFGGVARVATDYNSTDYGFAFGADVTRHFHLVDPSIEVRYTHSSGDVVGENSFLGGIKVEKQFRNFHPYLDGLFGYGVINFTHPTIFPTGPYSTDNSFVRDFGGGLDYDVTANFAVKADYQTQTWKLGAGNQPLSPTVFTVGVVYRIPFRPLPSRR